MLGAGGMGVAGDLLHVLDRCLELDRTQRADIRELAELAVCKPGYAAALAWPHVRRQLPQRLDL